MCRTPSGSERKRKRLGVTDGDNGKSLMFTSHCVCLTVTSYYICPLWSVCVAVCHKLNFYIFGFLIFILVVVGLL